MNRKTSTYKIEIESSRPHDMADAMIARCPVDVDTSGVFAGRAHVRFRCKTDDNLALNIALKIAGGQPFVLTTGYGPSQREIEQ